MIDNYAMLDKHINEEQIYATRKDIKELELLIDCGHPKLAEIRRLITESQERLQELLQEKELLDQKEVLDN
jgi:hypothetical protein